MSTARAEMSTAVTERARERSRDGDGARARADVEHGAAVQLRLAPEHGRE